MANYFKFQRALQRRWPDLVREYRPDLLVVHHAQMPDLWTDSMPCPTVVTTHTTILGQARGIQGALRHGGPLDDTERTTLAVLPALLPIELYYWNRVRHVLFVSDAVRHEVLGTYDPRPRTSALIPNGLGLDELRGAGGTADSPEEPGFILYTGRLLGWKGLADLPPAMVHVRRTERRGVTGSGPDGGGGRPGALLFRSHVRGDTPLLRSGARCIVTQGGSNRWGRGGRWVRNGLGRTSSTSGRRDCDARPLHRSSRRQGGRPRPPDVPGIHRPPSAHRSRLALPRCARRPSDDGGDPGRPFRGTVGVPEGHRLSGAGGPRDPG